MTGNATKLIGMLVWRGGKWYVRQRLPATRVMLAWSLGGLALLVAGTFIARRAGA